MDKCGICGKECEDFTKTKYSIFDSNTSMCKDCYEKFLKENFNKIINHIIDYTVAEQNINSVHQIFDDFDIYDSLYSILEPTHFSSLIEPIEPNSIIKIVDKKSLDK
jgi:ribosome-binding protein aMBF1 (putative translation factor)